MFERAKKGDRAIDLSVRLTQNAEAGGPRDSTDPLNWSISRKRDNAEELLIVRSGVSTAVAT